MSATVVETAKATELKIWPFRFHFRAVDTVYFPDEKATNILRGAFGTMFRRLACVPECESVHTCSVSDSCPYARIFEPRQELHKCEDDTAPSGFADWPRPFVFRALHLNGRKLSPGEEFYFDLVLFEHPERALPYFVLAFREVAQTGLGPGRGRATLTRVDDLSAAGGAAILYEDQRFTSRSPVGLSFDFAPIPETVASSQPQRIVIEFLTPTEIKSRGAVTARPEFADLFARLRDRISNLRACYQGGPLAIDFHKLGDQARTVNLVSSDLHAVDAVRQSSRTGQRHSIGGLIGRLAYEGEIKPFLPFLQAAQWTGVGRQTVWGKGEIRLVERTENKATAGE